MTLAMKFTPLSEAAAPAAARRVPDLTLIEGRTGDNAPAIRDTLGAHFANAFLATYALFFTAHAIATHLI